MKIQSINSIHQLVQLVQAAEKNGEKVVFLGDNSVRIVKHNALEKIASHLSRQHKRETESLDKFAAHLLAAEYNKKGVPLLDRHSRIGNLIGKTIHTEVAASFLDKSVKGGKNPVLFDGTGRIQSIHETPRLSEIELIRLEMSVVQDLGSLNAKGERTAARTASECVLEALGLLKQLQAHKQGGPEGETQTRTFKEFQDPLEKLWLSGKMDNASAQATLASVAQELSKFDADLGAQVLALSSEAGKEKTWSQGHDNTFGRLFESAVGKHLVDRPSPKMLEAASVINTFMLNHMMTPQKHYTVEQNIEILAKALKKDSRPWHAEVPQLQNFLNQPSSATLKKLLEPAPSNGYEMMMTYWMAAKLSSEVTGPWMQAANENYNNLIKPSRSSEFTALSANGVERSAYGAVVGGKVLDKISTDLDRPSSAKTLGLSKDEINDLRDSVNQWSNELAKASGSFVQAGQLLPADREAILSSLMKASVTFAKSFPEEAQTLSELHDRVLASESIEVGTKSNIHAMDGATNVMSNQYGTALVHQPKNEVPEHWKAAVNLPAKTGLNVNAPTAFEKSTLERNQNTVNGVSGTTNMLTFMLLHMKENKVLNFPSGEPIDMGDALAGNLAFLLMDGGHTIPEAMATSEAILVNPKYFSGEEFIHLSTPENKNGANNARKAANEEIRLQRQNVLDQHVTNYSELGQKLGSAQTSDAVNQAVAAAFEQTRQSFDRLHQQRTQ